jgi:hypothetical protein
MSAQFSIGEVAVALRGRIPRLPTAHQSQLLPLFFRERQLVSG